MRAALVAIGLALAGSAWAQSPGRNEVVQLGSLATLAPLCGLRSEQWGFDLRRAAIQSATGSRRFDDPALRAAPGSNRAAAALAYADTEALESFAEGPPERTCAPLALNPDLARADDIVRAFRAQRDPAAGS